MIQQGTFAKETNGRNAPPEQLLVELLSSIQKEALLKVLGNYRGPYTKEKAIEIVDFANEIAGATVAKILDATFHAASAQKARSGEDTEGESAGAGG